MCRMILWIVLGRECVQEETSLYFHPCGAIRHVGISHIIPHIRPARGWEAAAGGRGAPPPAGPRPGQREQR